MTTMWEMKPLASACEIKPAKAEARRHLADSDEVSFLPMEDLSIEQMFAAPTKSRQLSDVMGGYTYFAEGDVLLAKITPCFENGKLGIAKGLVNGVGFGSSEYIVFRPNAELDARWLYYFLSRDSFRAEGRQRMGGAVGHKRVAKEFIDAYSIPVPPVREQQRIVDILDEAFAGIETARSNAGTNFKATNAIFSSFLASIFAEHDWPTRTLDQLAINLDSRRVPITKSDRETGEYPYYGASGIVDYVADYIFDGDALLISEDGANLLARSTPIAFSVSGKYWVNNHAHILKFESIATQRFVEFYLDSIPLDEYITGAAQPKLNQKALNSIPVPIPSTIKEQAEVVSRIEAVKRQVLHMATLYERKLVALDALRQSLLHRAFSGQL